MRPIFAGLIAFAVGWGFGASYLGGNFFQFGTFGAKE